MQLFPAVNAADIHMHDVQEAAERLPTLPASAVMHLDALEAVKEVVFGMLGASVDMQQVSSLFQGSRSLHSRHRWPGHTSVIDESCMRSR
jgi:hypothetical protein